MERNKIELIGCTLIGCVGLGFAFFGIFSHNQPMVSIGSAVSSSFPILGVIRLLS